MISVGDVPVTFAGSADEQAFAERLLGLLRTHGRFMSADAPIRVSIASVAAFMQSTGEDDAEPKIEAAIERNPAVFAKDEIDGEPYVVTTRAGRAAAPRAVSINTFAQRFMTPRPKPERPATPVRERPRVDPSWVALPPVLEGIDELAAELIEPEALALEPTAAPAAEVAEPAAVVEAEPIEPEPAAPVARTITLPPPAPTDVTDVDDLDLANAIRERLSADPRVANFGEQWMMEDRAPRFSRGDLRRMKDYLQEQERPLTDDVLAQDVLQARPGTPDFDLYRFAVDYRLSREHREFEFVGTANQRFWTTSGLPQLGTTRRKPNEIGSDYRYLLDEAPAEPRYRSRDSVDHVLTFYEYIHGLLPYDAEMQELLPAPLLPNQRAAVLTFECPQSYTTYLVELRFPTPNRGGYILGLDDFYSENLVPGSIISINRTDNDGHYRVEYIPEAGQSARLLELDERRSPRYVFRPTTFSSGVEDAMLLTEERFGGLANEKPLDEKVRRRPESVVAATFERIGENRDGNFSADFITLLAGVNVERPTSATLLRSILDNDDSGAFSRDPDGHDAYTYVPGTTP
ncbi:MAG TPA: hypothetical protein VFU81_01875 [Thermomicrobiales bacterium]|nr:hypothetical protein [Thermomicrobiales bacterium]